MDESALKTLLDNLAKSQFSLHHWLHIWTGLVVAGVVLEVVFVVWEYAEDLHDFRRGIVHPPEKPGVLLLVLGLLGAGLVAVGVAGELYIDVQAGKVETDIRNANELRVSLLLKEAGEAKNIASANELEAERLRQETALIEESLAWRRLSPHDKQLLASRLSQFTEQKLWILFNTGDAEGATFAWDIATALHDNTKLNVLSPGAISVMSPLGLPFTPSSARITTGLLVGSSTNPRSLEAAKVLLKALVECGFDATLNPQPDKRVTPDISINVESRPRGPQGDAKLKLETARKNAQSSQAAK